MIRPKIEFFKLHNKTLLRNLKQYEELFEREAAASKEDEDEWSF